MRLTLETIKREASSSAVYSRGLDYMKKNHVKKAGYMENGDFWTVKAQVSGGSLYEVEVTINPEGEIEDYSCTCEAYESYDGLCKHCVAALLYAQYTLSQQGKLENGNKRTPAVQARNQSGRADATAVNKTPPSPPRMRTDSMARSLLATFPARDNALASDARDVLFVPTLEVGDFAHGIALTFTVGTERQYVVKNLRDFIYNVDNKARVIYGKELSFTHSLNAFEPESRRLVCFVKKWLNECRISAQGGYRYYTGYYGNDERRLLLSPDALEEFFNTFCGQTFNSNASGNAPLTLTEDRPEIIVNTEFMPDGGMMLQYTGSNSTYIAHHIYIMQEIKTDKSKVEKRLISRCDTDRSDAISDFMKALIINKGVLNFAEEDISAFCSSVLPEIEAHLTLAGSEDRLKTYLPEKMSPHIYLDAPGRSKINGLPAAEYGGDMINILNGSLINITQDDTAAADSKAPAKNKHRRDARAEYRFLSLLGSCMDYNLSWTSSGFMLEGDDAVYHMLTEGIEKLRAVAVVHISDRLKRYALNPPFKANVGVSLDGGLLKMDLDTLGLPLEQLADVLSAYREKRKYFRLKDGSFIKLSDGALDDFAQLADGLQLTDKQLSSGQITVPAFRALYLDGLFSERNSGLTLSGNEAFGKLAQSMRNFGKNNYEIPETLQGIMRSYQETGYRWLRSLEDCSFCGILADDMGLGKSLQLISLMLNRYNTLRQEGSADSSNLPSLIVCPASLILNWKSELNKFAPSLPVRIITGAAAGRKELIAGIEPDEIVITSYDLLKKDIEQYSQKQFHYFAIDEAQYIKNQNTKSAQSVKQIVCRQRFALTGTPIENRLSELWSIFDFLMPGYLYGYTRFRQKFELPVVKNEDENAREHLRRLIAPFVLRRLKTEVLTELPPKVNTVIPVELDMEQRTLYTAAMTVGLRELKNSEQTPKAKTGEAKMKIFAFMTRLRQICCDPSLCYEDYKGESAKLETCIELLSEAKNGGHKVLLFSQFTSMLSIIRKRLDSEGISYMVLQGSTPKEKRLEMVERFNEGNTDVFLISLKAGGTGLNLTGANVVIHYDPWWNMAAQEQATDRAHRIGQTQSVQVYKLIAANTIEERILKLQEMKGDLASVIDADGEQPLMNMSVEDMLELLESR